MDKKLTASQIRYIIWLHRLSPDGSGVRNAELAGKLEVSKPSVHNMLKMLCDINIVSQESYGLAHLTDFGRTIAARYYSCFEIIRAQLCELCGEGAVTESSLCNVLSDIPYDIIKELSN